MLGGHHKHKSKCMSAISMDGIHRQNINLRNLYSMLTLDKEKELYTYSALRFPQTGYLSETPPQLNISQFRKHQHQ